MANIVQSEISKALEEYYLPYAKYVVAERAIPQLVDGLKPSQRASLFSMYKAGLLNGNRIKSANAVGQVMAYHPHGDSSIYGALTRMAQSDSLLHPLIDGKGNMGMHTSKDVVPSAPRYTEMKLAEITKELFFALEKDVVDFKDNYDNTKLQPVSLPSAFPNVLVMGASGIAEGYACNIPSFNLKEVCNLTIEYIKSNKFGKLLVPDFPTGGEVYYNEQEITKMNIEGIGKCVIRSKWKYDDKNRIITIYEIPYNTTREAIIESIITLIKNNKVKNIVDVRDATDIDGSRIEIDIKRNTDIQQLMDVLFSSTPLQSSFSANINVIHNNKPEQMGVQKIIQEWVLFRQQCVRRETQYDYNTLTKELNVLKGFITIIDNIDKVIATIRATENDDEVIPTLCRTFNLDIEQAEAIANVKLRNLNKAYLLKRIKDFDNLKNTVTILGNRLKDIKLINDVIIIRLKEIIKKYGMARKTDVLYDTEVICTKAEEITENYNVLHVLTKQGYYKKIPLTSLRSSKDYKLKDDDISVLERQGQNIDDILVFTNTGNVHRIKASKVENTKLDKLGIFLPTELNLPEEEKVVSIVPTSYEENENVLICYENGYIARISIETYKSSYSTLRGRGDTVIAVYQITDDIDLLYVTEEGKGLIFNTQGINSVSSRIAKGVKAIRLQEDNRVISVHTNVQSNTNIILGTTKKGEIKVKVDVTYYTGTRGNVGVFLYNCRANKDKIIYSLLEN